MTYRDKDIIIDAKTDEILNAISKETDMRYHINFIISELYDEVYSIGHDDGVAWIENK